MNRGAHAPGQTALLSSRAFRTLERRVPKSDNRPTVTMACGECKRRNYVTEKNRINDRDRIELKKYCRWCGRHTVHKETR